MSQGQRPGRRYDAGSDALLQLDEKQLTLDGYHNGQCDYLLSLLP